MLCTHWLAVGASTGDLMPLNRALIIERSSMVLRGNWATIRSSLCCQINSPGFSMNDYRFLSLDLPPLPADRSDFDVHGALAADRSLSDFDVHGALEDPQVTQNVNI
jgi:hypothetical protein